MTIFVLDLMKVDVTSSSGVTFFILVVILHVMEVGVTSSSRELHSSFPHMKEGGCN